MERGLSEDFAKGLADRFNTSVAEVVNFARRIARPDMSLDSTFPNAGRESPIIEQLQDEKPTPEDSLVAASEGRLWLEWLGRALSGLPPRELLIIRRRFLTDKAPSRAALARELGLSKERVRQLEVARARSTESHASAASRSRRTGYPPVHPINRRVPVNVWSRRLPPGS